MRPAQEPSLAELLDESADHLYEHAPCGYLSTLPDGSIVKVNATLLDWLGYGRDELLGGVRIHDLLAPGDRIWYETHYAPLLQMQGEVRGIAVELVRADRTRLPALVNSTLTRGADGATRLIHTSVFDASDRRSYERELLRARADAESRAQAARALAHVNDGVLLVGPDGRLALVNDAAAAILGIEDDAVGRPVGEAVPGWDGVGNRIPVGGRDRWPAPAVLPLTHGDDERWVAIAGVDAGDGVVYTFRDVTAERHVERVRDDLIAVVSHELRTPLAGASGAAQTLLHLGDSLPPEQRTQLLEMIVEQSERLRVILDEMLFTSRLDSGALELADDAFDAAALLQTAVAAAADERVVVEAEEPLSARGDEALAQQVLSNLIENALQYAPPPTPVRVSVSSAGRRARFTVVDEGPGVPPAERERIFERFYRLDPDQRGGVSGIGLGLYVARALAERMGGEVGLEPRNTGAAFFFELPIADVPAT